MLGVRSSGGFVLLGPKSWAGAAAGGNCLKGNSLPDSANRASAGPSLIYPLGVRILVREFFLCLFIGFILEYKGDCFWWPVSGGCVGVRGGHIHTHTHTHTHTNTHFISNWESLLFFLFPSLETRKIIIYNIIIRLL